MTNYYKCSCGYTSKNAEYAKFHSRIKGCFAAEYTSAFDGSNGLIAMIKHHKTSKFIKWYDSEDSLMIAHPDAKYRYSYDCDRDFVKLVTSAVHDGIVATYDANCPIVRNDSANKLFEKYI